MNVRLAMPIAIVAVGCEAGDLSDALNSGRCDSHDRCGAGFECNTRTRECVPLGTIDDTPAQGGSAGDAGAGGLAGPAGAAGDRTTAGSGGSPNQSGGQPPGSGSAGAPSGGQTGGAGSAGAPSGGQTGAGGSAVAGTAGQGCSGAPLCDGVCVDTSSDPNHCGSCDRVCSSSGTSETPRCVGGACVARCTPGLANCSPPDSQPDDGCETELTRDDAHCGSCDNTCTTRTTELGCVQGRCGCTDASQCGDPQNGASCGKDRICSCDGTTCQPGETCFAKGRTASCSCDGKQTCAPEETCCIGSGRCVDLETSIDHCGTCGRSCPTRFRCSSGECRCADDAGCDAGSAGVCADGFCTCTGVLCRAGERCLADGSCG